MACGWSPVGRKREVSLKDMDGAIEGYSEWVASTPSSGDGDDPLLGTWMDPRGGRLLRLMDGELWEGKPMPAALNSL